MQRQTIEPEATDRGRSDSYLPAKLYRSLQMLEGAIKSSSLEPSVQEVAQTLILNLLPKREESLLS